MTTGEVRPEIWEELAEWWRVALLSFGLRFPAELAGFPKASPRHKEDRDRCLRYGWELDATEQDLSKCIRELDLAVTLHQGNLALKKFAVVYHTDNFNVRVHKLRENAYTLVALAVGLNPTDRPAAGDAPLREQIRRALEKRCVPGFREAITDFENNKVIKAAIEARHAFVHRYRDESARGVGARERYAWLPEPKDDPLAEAVRVLDEASIDIYIAQQEDRLAAAIEPIRVLRLRLFDAAAREVLRLGARSLSPARMDELKAFVDPFADLV